MASERANVHTGTSDSWHDDYETKAAGAGLVRCSVSSTCPQVGRAESCAGMGKLTRTPGYPDGCWPRHITRDENAQTCSATPTTSAPGSGGTSTSDHLHRESERLSYLGSVASLAAGSTPPEGARSPRAALEVPSATSLTTRAAEGAVFLHVRDAPEAHNMTGMPRHAIRAAGQCHG
jgi:hypothetical protein